MESIGSALFFVLLGLGLSACSKQYNKAPRSPEELGTIVVGPSLEEVENTSLPFRVVNQDKNLYEIKSSVEKLSQLFPQAKIEANRMDLKLIRPAQFNNVKKANQQIDAFVRGCSKSKLLRVFALNKEENPDREKFSKFSMSEHNDLLSLQAVVLSNDKDSMQFLWALSFSGLGNYQEFTFEGSDLDLPLKGVGEYKITLIAKDKSNICGVARYIHLATSNEPFQSSGVTDFEELSRDMFYHLNESNVPKLIASRAQKTRVAVIDSGVNYNHPLLNGQMAVNSGEIPNNGIDDDQNGFTDDYIGYDFFNDDPHPMDDVGHGSHVAGLIGAKQLGTSQNIEILAIKVGSFVGVDSASVAGAIFYAVDRKAKVINLSLGGETPPTQVEMDAFNYAKEHGVLVVIAAGNGDSLGLGLSIDHSPVYPAAIDLENMMTVAASSLTAKPLTRYSNYGQAVDIVAPGGDFFSPLMSAALINDVGVTLTPMHGTSMAAPIVSGAAGELLSIDSELSPERIKSILVDTGRKDPQISGLIKNNRHLDVGAAVLSITNLNLAWAGSD